MRTIKPEKIEEPAVSLEPAKVIYPSLYIELKHLPEAKDWEAGKSYFLKLKVKQRRLSISKTEDEEGEEVSGEVSFDILGIEPTLPPKKSGNDIYLDD